MTKKFEMDMTSGPLLKKLILYALPIVGVNIVQLLFNAADVAVLGMFASIDAVAAVGANTALINLLIGLFIGFSVSANVLVARYMGAGDQERVRRVIGTSVFISIIIGVILAIIGIAGAELFLTWMNCPPAIFDMAVTYLRIYFLGMPIIMLYNFTASIMRAVGDTLRPLIFLIIGGVLNIGLNIFFIVVLHRDVEGVAIATVASQAVSAILSLIVLIKGEGYAKLEKKHFRFYKDEFKEIVSIGLPTGLSRCMFSLSNVVLVSTLNGFGKQVIAANTIAHQFDAIIHDATDAFAMGTLSFVSQNLGAKNFKRIWLTIIESLILVTGIGLLLSILTVLFARPLCGIMTSTPEVIEYAVTRLTVMGMFYFLTGIMNVFGNVLKGMGKATTSMIGSLICTVVFRLFWIYVIFPLNPTLEMYYMAYPISWGLCAVVFAILAIPMLIKKQREVESEKEDYKQISDNQLESTN